MIPHGFMLVRLAACALCLFGALWWGVEGVTLFLKWRPVTGEVIGRSYSDAQQLADRADHPWDRVTNLDPHSIKATVTDILRVRYVVDGRVYEQDVRTGHLRGERADSSPLLWYDPQDPSRLLRNGPGLSFGCAAAALFAAALCSGLL